MTLADRIAEAERLIKAAVEEAANQVAAGTQNPAIYPLGGSGRAFTMSSSELARTNNWSPGYLDWMHQYALIGVMLKLRQFSKIREILKTGRLGSGHNRVSFAPEVVERVRSIVGELLEHTA